MIFFVVLSLVHDGEEKQWRKTASRADVKIQIFRNVIYDFKSLKKNLAML